MHFWTNSLQSVAGATGASSRVQLPAAGRLAVSCLANVRGLPLSQAAPSGSSQRTGLARHRAQHRAQCRANCMSKANF
ncbi:hypothetical protein [Hymenobacter glacialis]|uniref:Uncharacterized protein n=1 Tax=Hymenobacter glacialis TaxID=1908236 RepID=A0A1G1SWI1_9BACT|nr:hypothetical protein [Hymenobacter glacialis]OGX82980.1 hypothetical protein BEN48_04265 [Hymenobacter glacialis]